MTKETADEDIVIRLRAWADSFFPPTIEDVLVAADEIERLREDVSDLKELMQATVNYAGVSVSTEKYAFHAMKDGE